MFNIRCTARTAWKLKPAVIQEAVCNWMPTLEQESNIKEFETLQRLTLESEKRTDHDGRA